MNTQIKNYLQVHTGEIVDLADHLRLKDADKSLVDLVDRIGNLGSISLLNFESLSEAEMESVMQSLKLCSEMLKPENESKVEQYSHALNEVAERIEDLFRHKKILLDKKRTKLVA